MVLDGYRFRMRFRALKMLEEGGITVYAVPAHTSGVTQPLDVGVFSPFKAHLRNLMEDLSSPMSHNKYGVLDFLKLVRTACEKAFTRSNKTSSFGKSSVHPLDWGILTSTPRLLSSEHANKLATVQDIETMIDEKRTKQSQLIGLQPAVLQNGFVDTTNGLCLTSSEALIMGREQDGFDTAKRAERSRKEAEKDEKDALSYERTKMLD